ncbi:DUF3617 domain-containing protein [Sphingomonas sp. MMS24-J45]|uniref:DUF3617 domain-containing protein n=1 Tax=Sphingomonas sp. MMS24-J45 TaxID=3238806 RepID=UPI00384E7CB0
MTGALAAAAPARAPTLTALTQIEPGQWQFKSAGSSAAPSTSCIADADTLIQYGHASLQCQRFIIANEANIATVHFTCPGSGHGRTSVKVTTARNFSLDTQGIINGAPFEEQYEARRIGACPANGAAH